jgi:hypothetical protein
MHEEPFCEFLQFCEFFVIVLVFGHA